MKTNRIKLSILVVFFAIGLIGTTFNLASWLMGMTSAQEPTKLAGRLSPNDPAKKPAPVNSETRTVSGNGGERLMSESPAAYEPDWERPYPQYQPVGKELKAFPKLRPGDISPTDLYRYGGPGESSFAS